METALRLEHLSKKYHLGPMRTNLASVAARFLKGSLKRGSVNSEENILWALRDVNFELERGHSLGLIGRNGAGKSTILKILAKITHPTLGKVGINGRVSALIELGSGFHGDLTGRENIYLNGTILGLSRKEIQARFDEIVDFSEIEPFIDTPLKRYSSGMLVRLGFAVASCLEPDVLLADEVLAVGDAAFRQKCLNRITSLLSRGTSIIFVSHDLNMVQGVCQSALYLKNGRIAYSGRTRDAIDWYERDLHEERAWQFSHNDHQEDGDGSRDVHITRVEVVSTKGMNSGDFRGNQSAEIKIYYNAYKSINEISGVVRIIRSDGVTVCRMRTSIDGIKMSLPQGEGVFSVLLDPLQLTCGTYFALASIRTERDLVRLDTRQSKWFYVAGSPLSHAEENGFFEPRRTWKLASLVEPSFNQQLPRHVQDDD